MASIRLRRFRPEDAAAVAALVAHTTRVSNASDYPREVIDRIAAELSRERLPVLVAIDGAVVVATGALERDWIHALFVHPDRQREGIGRRLMRRLETMATARGASTLHLHATPNALAFYRMLGYETAREHRSPRFGHVIEMRKSLGD